MKAYFKSPANLAIILLLGVATVLFVDTYAVRNRLTELNQRVDQLEYTIDSLNSKITEYEETVEVLGDDLQWKEEEISYWGQKYDSTFVELQKYKKKK